MTKSTAFILDQKNAFQLTDTGQPLGGLGLTFPGIPKIPNIADIQKFISDAKKTVQNYNIIGRKIAAVQSKINAVRSGAAKSALSQKIGSARNKFNSIASSLDKLKSGLGNATSIIAQVRSKLSAGRGELGVIQIGQIIGVITATTILIAVGGVLITINRYIDSLDREAQRQIDLERQQQEANYCAQYPNDPRCGGGIPQIPIYQQQLQQQYYQQYQPPQAQYYQPPVRQPTYEQYYYTPEAQYYQPEQYAPAPAESFLDLEQELSLFGLGSSDDQNRLWRKRRGLEGERDRRFDDILDIIPGIEGLGARDQRWDLKKNIHIDHRNEPGIFGLSARDQRWDLKKNVHIDRSQMPGMFGLSARDQRHDVLKHAGIGRGKCPKIECLLKEVGL